MDSITYNHETVVARRNSMLIVGVYLLRIQILVVGGYPAPTQWVCRLGGPGAGSILLEQHYLVFDIPITYWKVAWSRFYYPSPVNCCWSMRDAANNWIRLLQHWVIQNSCDFLALESLASRRTRPTKIFQLRLFYSKTYTSLIRNSSSIQTFSLILERCRFDKVISEFRFCTFYMRSLLKSDFESYDS
jgi:hypothetical protein